MRTCKVPPALKTFFKKVEKSVDNLNRLCYNKYRKREEDTEMLNWYMNPELHDEDYEELLALIREEEEEEE